MKTPTNVAEVMTCDVLTLTEDQDLRHIEETMRLFRFRHMPVVADGRLVGLISHRDVLRTAASSLLPNGRAQSEHLARTFHVRDVMTHPRVVHPETPLVAAARTMYREKLGCLPVVDESNVLVGILTDADFVRLALELLQGHAEPRSPRGTTPPAA